MSDHHRGSESELDPRLHAYFDDDLTPEEIAQFYGELRPGSTLDNRLKTLRRINDWFRTTRPRSPISLADSVQQILERESAARRPAAGVTRWWSQLVARMSDRWAWAPVAAAAALLVILPMLRSTPQPAWVSTTAMPIAVASDTVRYSFAIRADNATEVCLAGDFNQWGVCDLTLRHIEEDLWTVSLDLPPGRYEYMFVVDGAWVTDPNAISHVDDGFGNRNAVLVL